MHRCSSARIKRISETSPQCNSANNFGPPVACFQLGQLSKISVNQRTWRIWHSISDNKLTNWSIWHSRFTHTTYSPRSGGGAAMPNRLVGLTFTAKGMRVLLFSRPTGSKSGVNPTDGYALRPCKTSTSWKTATTTSDCGFFLHQKGNSTNLAFRGRSS